MFRKFTIKPVDSSAVVAVAYDSYGKMALNSLCIFLGWIQDFVTGGWNLAVPKVRESSGGPGACSPRKSLKSETSETPFSGF